MRAIEDRVAHESGSNRIRRSWSADSNDKDAPSFGAGAARADRDRPAHEKEQASRDYDFSESAIQGYQAEGYTVARATLGRA